MHVVHFPTKNYHEVNGKRKQKGTVPVSYCLLNDAGTLKSLFLVHSHEKRDLRRLKLPFDLVVKLLPVAIKLHNALRLLFHPELIELIRQVTYQQRQRKHMTITEMIFFFTVFFLFVFYSNENETIRSGE